MQHSDDDIDKDDLAEGRTHLAEDRTVLAHERSFASWLRTGMASVGIGLGFNALFKSLDPSWIPKAIATGFLLIAVFIFITAERRACAVIRRLEAHKVKTLKPMRMKQLAWALSLMALALSVAIWLFEFR